MQLKVDLNGNAKYIIPSVAKVKTSKWQIQDFPEEGAPTPRGGQHTILPYFPKNCMKLKEFGPPGGVSPSRPP